MIGETAENRRGARAARAGAEPPPVDLAALELIQARVLWLATAIVDHANRVRASPSRIKVGGHQASSASVVTLMTALWFAHLRAPDRVSVKPHASPVLHAINYLLGELDAPYLERLREFGGLQSYPSRTKDPDPVDYSTGSVGIGATQAIWGAIAHRYVAGHFEVPRGGRQIALLGDAELDEGAVWEAVCDPVVARLGEVLWIVDLNRQSLDRVVPEIAIGRLLAMFEAAGWHAVTVKYGPRLRALFERDGGGDLRRRIDEMPNEEYQRLLRSPPAELRERLPGSGAGRRAIAGLIAELGEPELRAAIRDLGGHDLGSVLDGLRDCDAVADRPSILFAYTIKGWGLPIEGHPANHSALLGASQLAELGAELGSEPADPWARFDPDSPEARICAAAAERLRREPLGAAAAAPLPVELGREHSGEASTQQELGRLFADLYREAPETAARVVTVSPDVASSTNLGGWINRVGVWSIGERIDWFADDTNTLVRWRESDHGQHIELGIAEVNLVGLLGELGATWSRDGQPLLPVGTIYDPFLMRCFEPWAFGIYAGGQSILIGTPSGVTLGPEGGAHQSVVTPSAGLEQPGCVAWEPAFAQDLEWTFLHALSRLGVPGGSSAYFRLTTRPIDQSLAAVPTDREARERRRRDVLAGGYRLREAAAEARLAICAVGALVPEALAAATELEAEGAIPTEVLCLTSPDLLFRALRARHGLAEGEAAILDRLLPPERPAPLVGVIDAHPHTLAFLGSVRGDQAAYLGVTEFGQSGDIADLYPHHGIDAETIAGAALDLL